MTAVMLFTALCALAISALCSGAETGFLSVSRGRIVHLAREGGRRAKLVQSALADLGRTTTTILIGNNIANVTYSTAMAALGAAFCGKATALAIWSFFAAFLVLYTAEFLPKLFCSARPLRRILVLAEPYWVMAGLLRPLTALAMAFTNLFVPQKTVRPKLTLEDMLRILQDRKDGVCLSDLESALIARILVLRAKGRKITPDDLLSALAPERAAEEGAPQSGKI